MPINTFETTCTELLQLTSDVWQLRFAKPEGLDFVAGQYLLFQVPLVENENDIQPRAYSIASAPHEDDLVFVVKVFPGGRFSEYLLQKMKVGSTMKMQGPIGRFTLGENKDHHLMIATGTGVAPFRSHIVDLIHKKDSRPIDLIFGVRSEVDQFWMDELQELAVKHGNLRLHVPLSKGSNAWSGLRGRVQEHIDHSSLDPKTSHIFACGNPQMTLEVKKRAIEELAMDKHKVHVEGYV